MIPFQQGMVDLVDRGRLWLEPGRAGAGGAVACIDRNVAQKCGCCLRVPDKRRVGMDGIAIHYGDNPEKFGG